MRRALAASLVAAAALLPSTSLAHPAATLRLVDRSPVTVAGSYFHPRERVTVTFYGKGTVTATARTNRSGSFRVAFDTGQLGRCEGVRIRAVGARGDVAMIKTPLPACMPARSP